MQAPKNKNTPDNRKSNRLFPQKGLVRFECWLGEEKK